MTWGDSVLIGLFESWLVEAPQRQAYGNSQPRSHIADLVIAVPAGIDEHFAERVQFFNRHRKFFPEQINQSRYARRAAGHHDALNIFTARRGTEKVEGL